MNQNRTPLPVAYADGSCVGNPGPGGWGVLIIEPDGAQRELSGGDPSTTNNRMEITAAIEALRAFAPGAALIVRTDSQYLVNTMTKGWRRRENLDLWQQLDIESTRREVRFEWVRGHTGDPLNQRADELARNAALEVQRAGHEIFKASRVSASSAGSAGSSRLAGSERELALELRPMLRAGEALARCGSCGRLFVTQGSPASRTYCSLAECQLRARRRQ